MRSHLLCCSIVLKNFLAARLTCASHEYDGYSFSFLLECIYRIGTSDSQTEHKHYNGLYSYYLFATSFRCFSPKILLLRPVNNLWRFLVVHFSDWRAISVGVGGWIDKCDGRLDRFVFVGQLVAIDYNWLLLYLAVLLFHFHELIFRSNVILHYKYVHMCRSILGRILGYVESVVCDTHAGRPINSVIFVR